MKCRGVVAEVSHPELGRVTIRTPSLKDKPLLEEFLRRLSEESVFHRFFRRLRSPREVVDRILGEDTLFCIIALRGGEVVACGELYKTAWPDTAEPAVTVLDAYQGRGLGKLMVMIMARCALEMGVRRFRAYVLADNTPIIRIIRRLSPRLAGDYGDTLLYEMRIDEARGEVERVLREWGLRDP